MTKSELQTSIEIYAEAMLPLLKEARDNACDFGESEDDFESAGFDVMRRLHTLITDLEEIAKGDWRLEDSIIGR